MAKLIPGKNDLATLHPELAAEADGWDPSTVTEGSEKRMPWKCNKGHKWEVRVSNRKKLEECVVGASSIEKDLNSIHKLNFLKKNSVSFRNMGSAALDLAYVASGKLDAFWGYNLNLWDIAAGIILVLEAGGTVTTSNFDKWDISSRDILASNSFIHSKVLKI